MRTPIIKTLLVIILGYISYNSNSQSILEWRGLNRTGFFPTKNILNEWPEKGPLLLLHVEDLPESYSSVIMKNEIMYTTGIEDTLEMLTAIDLHGNILWQTAYGNSWHKTFRNARCTPTLENNFAYMISGAGDVASIDINTGKLIWTVDAYTEFEGECGLWGVAESPLIIDNLIIYSPCGNKTTLIALNKFTGETVWISESIKDQSAYCSPIAIEREGIKLIITVTGNYVIGLNSENGEIFWKFHYTGVEEFKTGHDINPITPLIKGNDIFVTSGYNHVGVMLVMSEDFKSVKLKWKTKNLDAHHGGVVEHKGNIYGSNFSTVVSGSWACIDWNTGELKYEHDWFTKGQIIKTEDYLFCYDERKGNIALVEPTPEEFRIISSFKVKGGNGPHWSHPTIYDDKLFLRHGKSLLVYNIGEK